MLGHFATGVTVVAAALDGAPTGLSVNSFASVSLVPPLVSFCVGRRSRSWAVMAEASALGVSILAADQEDLCRTFASPGADRFAGVSWWPAPSGSPIVAGCVAWLDCRAESVQTAGDHYLVVALVTALGRGDGEPLVFYRGRYGRFQP